MQYYLLNTAEKAYFILYVQVIMNIVINVLLMYKILKPKTAIQDLLFKKPDYVHNFFCKRIHLFGDTVVDIAINYVCALHTMLKINQNKRVLNIIINVV